MQHMPVTLRRPIAEDAPVMWSLNSLPNVGPTADSSVPLALEPLEASPAAFPDLADVHVTFIGVGGEFLVAEMDGHVVGMAGFKPSEEGAEVLRVRVHPATRRMGIGAALMSELERRASALGIRRLHLDTADNQPEAGALYRGLKYNEVGTETRPEWSWTLIYFAKDLDSIDQ